MQGVAAAQLLRKQQVRELLQISMSTMCSWLQEGGRYYKPLFPRPTYFEDSRTPFWHLADIQEFIATTGAKRLSPAKPKSALPALKASEIVQSASQSYVANGDHPPAAPMRQATFKATVPMDNQKVQLPTRIHVTEIYPFASV